jgi:hypothetical protein
MRGELFASALALVLTLGCLPAAAFAQCDDKSQQNAADEAAVRGDLAAGSKCADASDAARSEQKNEDAAVRAKSKMDSKPNERSGTTGQGERREKAPAQPSGR